MTHTPVFLNKVIEALNPGQGKIYIDATYGEGGHSCALIEKGAKVLGIDCDVNQIDAATSSSQLILTNGNFKDIEAIAHSNGIDKVDGVLVDLGLSFDQIIGLGRGLSYDKAEEELDMRLDPQQTETTAATLLNKKSVSELELIFEKNAELVGSKKICEAIVARRLKHPINKVKDLMQILHSVEDPLSHKTKKCVFQALRIEVNHEIENLKLLLPQLLRLSHRNTTIVFISFHSLEDRIVKTFMKNSRIHEVEKYKGTYKDHKFERSAIMRVYKI